MLFSEAFSRKVVSTSTAELVGHVHEFLIDPNSRRVVGLSLTKTPGNASVLRWPDIRAFGADAVTVEAADKLVVPDSELAELSDKRHSVARKRVLTTHGLQIGSVQDVDFDPQDGRLLALLLENGSVPGDSFLGSGSYAVLVRG